jgi:predicted GNAT family acetyltransferase
VPFTVTDNPTESRYELRDGDSLAGIAAYVLHDDTITFTHTEVADEYEGQGGGSQLARTALDDSRSRRRGVVARCPFISGWIERHPEYADLLR